MGNIRRYAIYLQSSSLHCNACIDGYLRSNIPCPLPSVPAGIRVGAYAEGNGMDLAMEVLQEELLQKVHKSYDPEQSIIADLHNSVFVPCAADEVFSFALANLAENGSNMANDYAQLDTGISLLFNVN